jgi:hypothetical protein
MIPIGVCIHNTANDASAKNEISYMVTNTNQTSFHFAVDDIEVWQGLPLNRNGWHAGDGATGEGNRKYIGIEICYSKSGGEKFTKAEERTAQFCAELLKERGWGIDRVRTHKSFSGKNCPHRTLELGWDRFLNKVSNYLQGDMQTIPEETFKELVGKSSQRDKVVGELKLSIGIAKDDELLIEVNKLINSLKDNVSSQQEIAVSLTKQITELNASVKKYAENEIKLDRKITSLEINAQKLDNQIGLLGNENDKLRAELKNKTCDIVLSEQLDKIIGVLEGYSGEKTADSVVNSISQREATRKRAEEEVALLENNLIIKLAKAIKQLFTNI